MTVAVAQGPGRAPEGTQGAAKVRRAVSDVPISSEIPSVSP